MQNIDHRVIKLLVGVIALSLAAFMQLASGEVLQSISESYHYRARDWFVGLLFAVAALFVSFKGANSLERKLTLIASIGAIGVAVFPCGCGRPGGSDLHFPAAATVFAVMGYFCWRFRKTASDKAKVYPEAKNRVRVYEACMVGMGVSLAMILAYVYGSMLGVVEDVFPAFVFWIETVWLMSFGVSWLAASRTLPIITNKNERFSIMKNAALEDSCK